jgi:hypothetical protein
VVNCSFLVYLSYDNVELVSFPSKTLIGELF